MELRLNRTVRTEHIHASGEWVWEVYAPIARD